MDHHQPFDVAAVAQLDHDTLPVVTTVSCFTGHFDAPEDPAISEALLRHADGGAIAIVAPAREGVPVFPQRSDYQLMLSEGLMDGTTQLLTHFWEAGLGEDITIGEALAKAKARLQNELPDFAGRHWVLCEMNLLGDPSLPIRARAPLPVSWSLPESIASGTTASVTVGTGVPLARVTIRQDGETLGHGTTDANGQAIIQLAKDAQAGDVTITASGPCNVTMATVPAR